jgi:hypothetical protein
MLDHEIDDALGLGLALDRAKTAEHGQDRVGNTLDEEIDTF